MRSAGKGRGLPYGSITGVGCESRQGSQVNACQGGSHRRVASPTPKRMGGKRWKILSSPRGHEKGGKQRGPVLALFSFTQEEGKRRRKKKEAHIKDCVHQREEKKTATVQHWEKEKRNKRKKWGKHRMSIGG